MTWHEIFLLCGAVLFAVALFVTWSFGSFGTREKNTSAKGE